MTSYPIDIRLAEEHITIGPVALCPHGITSEELTQVLGAPSRILTLQYNNTVYIYDRTGVRFWAENGIVSELQLVLETEQRETFPSSAFVGPIEYRKKTVYPPVAGSLLSNGELAGFVQNTDHLQYGVILFEAKTPAITYTAIINPLTENIKTISVS